MAKSKTMTVTNNVNYCLDTLKKAVAKIPDEKEKKAAQDAVKYLIDTSKGKEQLYRGKHCNYKVVIPPWNLETTHKFYKPKP